ncbi:MAG TPA: hypothetical protein VHC69_18130 [Polyangiaceae bacterium]|nr:hypothetical protein [Polyangiaceae bacterium]
MNPRLLIDGIVRQTTLLIAQLATSGGLRAPLAHIAGQVFLELAKELESQGVTKKVSADMFGMALRTYQRRTQRIARSATDRGRSLREAMFEYVKEREFVTRRDILERFERDDEATVRGVLHDFMESGLVLSTGVGDGTAYRITTPEEAVRLETVQSNLAVEAFVWSLVFREQPVSRDRLLELSGVHRQDLERALESLSSQGRIERLAGEDPVYRSYELVLDAENPNGWEAAVLDHFATVVKTICKKLSTKPKAKRAGETGGSTYHFTLFEGSPFERELRGELAAFRARMSALRERIDEHNRAHGLEDCTTRIDVYYGQRVIDEEDESDEEDGF